MSPKLVQTKPHTVENRGNTMAPLFLRLISWKSLTQSIKIFVKLDFFTNVLAVWFVFVYIRFSWDWLHQKKINLWFWQWQKMNFQLIGDDFFYNTNHKNNGAIEILLFSSLRMCISSDEFWRLRWKFTDRSQLYLLK